MSTKENLILSLKKFSFQYRSQSLPTLYDIDLEIRAGEKILIVGPSGSGKSTLAHCLNGLIPHLFTGKCEGEYLVQGADALRLGVFELSQNIGTVLQDPDVQFVGLTAAEDIAFSLENSCVEPALMRPRVAAVASLVEIEKHLACEPRDLSGGQKQRVSMAGVLVEDVDVLLFDEPLANLDPATGVHAITLIDAIRTSTDKTVIIIEHRLEDVLVKGVDRIILMDEGRIVADMSPDRMLSSSYLHSAGIREPLYITALKYAGAAVTEDMHPSHIDTIELGRRNDSSSAASKLAAWDIANQQGPSLRQHEVLLEVRNLSFVYPGSARAGKVVDDVSFALHSGECVSLVGRNGAGKSTLAKLICGFERENSGSLILKNRDIRNDSIMQRADHIGYVMQNPNQMISLSMIFDEVALALRSRGISEGELTERVNQALDVCGLYPFRKWPVNALSYGQKKRLTIASIMVMRPSLMILDEPTAGQDFRHYNEIMEFLHRLNRDEGLTLLLITHDMHLMLEYTTRAIVVSDGKILADESPARVLTDDALISAASLKRTSLYDLALRAGLPQPQQFVQHFIDYDRRVRSR